MATKKKILGYDGHIHPGLTVGSVTVSGVPFYARTQKTQRNAMVVCKCSCGTVCVFRADTIRGSCEKCSRSHMRTRGGKSRTRLYKTWNTMIGRCSHPGRTDYQRYGGRGIGVCDEWLNDFCAFQEWATSNGYSDSLTIDRIDNSKGYSPENCRWTNMVTQCRNRRSSKMITAWGETKTQEEWARDSRASVQEMCILRRLRKGMSPEDAISAGYKPNRHLERAKITAWGEVKTNTDWTKDKRCQVSLNCIRRRLKSGMTPEEAISLPPK